jgi:hypothetical protein
MRPVRALGAATATAAIAVTAAIGCGGSGDSGDPAYCADRDALQESIAGLSKVNVREQGVQGVQKQVKQVADDAQALARSAQSQFAPQANALKSSASTLTTTVQQAVSRPSSQSLKAVADDVSKLGTAFADLSESVKSKC